MKKEYFFENMGIFDKTVTRRDFILGTASTLVGLSLGIKIFGCGKRPPEYVPSIVENGAKGKSFVVLIRKEKVMDDMHTPDQAIVDKMLREGILHLSGEKDDLRAWKRYIDPSDTVGIKMNVMMTATHVEVVRAIIKSLHSIGVADNKIIIWDRKKAGVGYDGILHRTKKYGFRHSISKIVTDHCTALINVPGTKVHWLAGIGVALKNWLGAVTNINTRDVGVAFALHADSCAEACSINAIPVIRDKCRLVVVDALRPLFHGGPQVDPKYLWEYNGLLMSTDPVAIDTVCMKILQEKRNEYKGRDWPISPPAKHLIVADKKYGLGHSDWDNIELKEYRI
jgi:uncharacterized protein (DUF362 family)